MSSPPARRVRKAVMPVAGRGLSLLPATRAIPKALLPIVDRPLAEFAVEEAAAAGIEQVIFVTPRNGNAIEDHFAGWRSAGTRNVSFASVRQPEPRGLGHALACAETLVDDEPFALMLPDELVLDPRAGIGACIALFQRTQRSVLATEPITLERTACCEVIATERRGDVLIAASISDRPGPEAAASLTGLVGRHVLTPAIFAALRALPATPGEVRLADALAELMRREPVYALPLAGRRIDCGTRGGLVEAVLEIALRDPDLAPTVTRWHDSLVERRARPWGTPIAGAPSLRARNESFVVRDR